MNKKLVILTILLIALGLTSCGESNNNKSEERSQESNETNNEVSNSVYDKVTVSVIQSVAIPGGNYAPLDNATVPVAKLRKGKFNLKYNFTLNTDEDNKKAIIQMYIDFPADIYVKKLASSGFYHEIPDQSFYYISQHKGGTGSIEFEVEIPPKLYDETLPINFSFLHYELEGHTLRTIGGAVAGVATGVVAGVVSGNPATGIAVGAGTTAALAGGSFLADKMTDTDLIELLNKATPKSMNESRKQFAISARK